MWVVKRLVFLIPKAHSVVGVDGPGDAQASGLVVAQAASMAGAQRPRVSTLVPKRPQPFGVTQCAGCQAELIKCKHCTQTICLNSLCAREHGCTSYHDGETLSMKYSFLFIAVIKLLLISRVMFAWLHIVKNVIAVYVLHAVMRKKGGNICLNTCAHCCGQL